MTLETALRHCATLLCLLLALVGYEDWGAATVNRAATDAAGTLHSEVRVGGGLARFRCLESGSGHCHYTLFPAGCAAAAVGCDAGRIERFTLDVGDSRTVLGLPDGFTTCASANAETMTVECRPLAAAGTAALPVR